MDLIFKINDKEDADKLAVLLYKEINSQRINGLIDIELLRGDETKHSMGLGKYIPEIKCNIDAKLSLEPISKLFDTLSVFINLFKRKETTIEIYKKDGDKLKKVSIMTTELKKEQILELINETLK